MYVLHLFFAIFLHLSISTWYAHYTFSYYFQFLTTDDLIDLPRRSQKAMFGCGRGSTFYREEDLQAAAIRTHGMAGLAKKRAAREKREDNKRKRDEDAAADMERFLAAREKMEEDNKRKRAEDAAAAAEASAKKIAIYMASSDASSSDDDLPPPSGLRQSTGSAANTSTIPVKSKTAPYIASTKEAPKQPASSSKIAATSQPPKKKTNPTKAYSLIWICTHGKGRNSKAWRQKDLKIMGIYATKADAEEAKRKVMGQYECCGHGDILVGPTCWDEIDLVIREAPLHM